MGSPPPPGRKGAASLRRVDFENGGIVQNILQSAFPMLIAQILNLLYNIVDRVYIARIPEIGTAALGAVGVCFPVIVIITAFSNLFGTGGAPLFSIARGSGDQDRARRILHTCYTLLTGCALVLMAVGLLFARPILALFGASDNAMQYALPYMVIYLLGTLPSMLTTGLNPFVNAQGYVMVGMSSVVIGAVANLVLDPLFIFAFGMGVVGAAAATVLSQVLSAVFLLGFLHRRAEYRVRLLPLRDLLAGLALIRDIVSLGTAGFIMQLTNSLVTISCNNVLAATGGDLYVSVMTILSSVRQMVETPLAAITDGSSPIISYNYGARRPERVKKACLIMGLLAFGYALAIWLVIQLAPRVLIAVFSSDRTLLADTVPAMKLYFSTFIFMLLQYVGQTVFKSLNKKRQAVFFSLLRKVIIVVPLTYLLPYAFGLGTDGVFLAEPISNVIGGCACFLAMLATVWPELKAMAADSAAPR